MVAHPSFLLHPKPMPRPTPIFARSSRPFLLAASLLATACATRRREKRSGEEEGPARAGKMGVGRGMGFGCEKGRVGHHTQTRRGWARARFGGAVFL